VLRQVHPDMGISNGATAILNSFVNDIFERIGTSSYFFVAGLTFVAVLRQVHPDTWISDGATAILNSFVK
ncbi:hypothetical protein DFH29DRAFT_804228, partial [Suillus ampliporus]